jgi:hypothetical protein
VRRDIRVKMQKCKTFEQLFESLYLNTRTQGGEERQLRICVDAAVATWMDHAVGHGECYTTVKQCVT